MQSQAKILNVYVTGPQFKNGQEFSECGGFLKKKTPEKKKTTGDKDRKGSLGSASPKLLKTTRGENEEEEKKQTNLGHAFRLEVRKQYDESFRRNCKPINQINQSLN